MTRSYPAVRPELDAYASPALVALLSEHRRIGAAAGEAVAEHRRLEAERANVEVAERARLRDLLTANPSAKSGTSLVVAHEAKLADAAARAAALVDARNAAGAKVAEQLEADRPIVAGSIDSEVRRRANDLAERLATVLADLGPLEDLRALREVAETWPDAHGSTPPIVATIPPTHANSAGLPVGDLIARARDAMQTSDPRRRVRVNSFGQSTSPGIGFPKEIAKPRRAVAVG